MVSDNIKNKTVVGKDNRVIFFKEWKDYHEQSNHAVDDNGVT